MMFVFVDTETTGLNSERDLILEVGISIWDEDLNKIAEQAYLIDNDIDIERNLDLINPKVVEMHSKGSPSLFEELRTRNTFEPEEAEANLIDFLENNEAAGLPMTGSTISFDRAFLKEHMPGLESTFHYRNVDVSSLRILREMYDVDPVILPNRKLHRVIPDMEDSAEGLKNSLRWVGSS